MSSVEASEAVFHVLDVVASAIDGEAGALGIVTEVRYSAVGSWSYCVAPLDPDSEEAHGLYGEHQLQETGRTAPVARFWVEPQRAREIVVVTDDHPKKKWRGLYGVISEEVEPATTYLVEFTAAEGWKHSTRQRVIALRHLRSTGMRLKPFPVPRPVQTWHQGRDQHNLYPAHDFTIIDELDQYL